MREERRWEVMGGWGGVNKSVSMISREREDICVCLVFEAVRPPTGAVRRG